MAVKVTSMDFKNLDLPFPIKFLDPLMRLPKYHTSAHIVFVTNKTYLVKYAMG